MPKNITSEEYVIRAKYIHNNNYDYSISNVNHSKANVHIKCTICKNIFVIRFDSHLRGSGCPNRCFTKKTTNDIITEFTTTHGNDRYDYHLVSYVGMHDKVSITCNNCGITFKQTPNSHKYGKGCPTCKESKGENKIRLWLTNNNIDFTTEHKFPDCAHKKLLPFDFYISDKNVCIEYDGQHHYEVARYFKNSLVMEQKLIDVKFRDNIKTQYCNDNHIKLIRIPYWDFDNIDTIMKKELV